MFVALNRGAGAGPRRLVVAAILALLAGLAVPQLAEARSLKKSIWGPVTRDGVSQFPIYDDLGVGLYQTSLSWAAVAASRPADPRDPADPVYEWPSEIDTAIAEARKHGIKVSLLLSTAPGWANGRKPPNWAPKRPSDFGDFAAAAARRYPGVRHWMIWGEPSRHERFEPLTRERRGRPLRGRQRSAPRLYARILDSAYARLKSVRRGNLVIGGNTFTTGDISPRNFIRYMRLPSGRPPRMDLYGHNPFSARKPRLSKPPLGHGFADFSDLDDLARWVDRHLGRGKKLFLSEYFLPTDHANYEFNFHVTRRTAAEWLTAALRITRRWPRIYTLGWFALYDDARRPRGDQVERGLLDRRGRRKPAYGAYKRG